jgi:hypothetical protein
MTSDQAAEVVRFLGASYVAVTSKFSEEQVRGMVLAYAAGLCDLEAEVVRGAIVRLARTSKFLPTIAEIREACITNARGPKRPGADAWGDVLAAVRDEGVYRRPVQDFLFKDPLVLRAVRSLGWSELCLSENQTADRARFIELYDSYERVERVEAQAANALGSSTTNKLVGDLALRLTGGKS